MSQVSVIVTVVVMTWVMVLMTDLVTVAVVVSTSVTVALTVFVTVVVRVSVLVTVLVTGGAVVVVVEVTVVVSHSRFGGCGACDAHEATPWPGGVVWPYAGPAPKAPVSSKAVNAPAVMPPDGARRATVLQIIVDSTVGPVAAVV